MPQQVRSRSGVGPLGGVVGLAAAQLEGKDHLVG